MLTHAITDCDGSDLLKIHNMYNKVVQNIKPLEFMWLVLNPFIFYIRLLSPVYIPCEFYIS